MIPGYFFNKDTLLCFQGVENGVSVIHVDPKQSGWITVVIFLLIHLYYILSWLVRCFWNLVVHN